MSLPQTEALPDHATIDSVSSSLAAEMILEGQVAAITAVRNASPDIVTAASIMADTIQSGGSLIYTAAGSSALMALADASELSGTFGTPTAQVRFHMAGGVPTDAIMPGDTEDGTDAARAIPITASDVAIILSASGSTPYALAAAKTAKTAGARIIAIANNPGAPLFDGVDVAICLRTPPEIVAGSTRLGAGTAQKAALNTMSTLMGVALGHVYQGMMVNVVADNAKLRQRAITMIRQIARVPEAAARSALQSAGGQVKAAILIASGHRPEAAKALLDQHKGHLGPCLNA